MGNLLERCGVDLSEPAILSLVPFTMLSSLIIKQINDALVAEEPLNSKLLANKAFTVLKKYFDNPGPLVKAFTFLEITHCEEVVNVSCLVAALVFYSNTSVFRKARCKLYLVLFRLFVEDRSRTLRLKELTNLIKSLIVGTRRMAGQSFPNSRIYKALAEECLIFADYKHIKRINSVEFISFIRLDHDLMKMISIYTPSMSLSENALPTIQHNSSVLYTQTRRESTPSNQDSGTIRQHSKSVSLPSTVKLPILSFPKVPSSYSPSEKLIYEAYILIYSLKSQVTEKGNMYLDLAYYLLNASKQKPIYMTRTDWSTDEISLVQAVNSFKCYFDYLDNSTNKSKRNESVDDNEIEAFARLYEMGDTEKVGWDKADVLDMFGQKSSSNAYYLIEKQAVKDKNRLQFCEFLKYCLPEHKKFDENSVNRFYSIFHKRKSSLSRCS